VCQPVGTPSGLPGGVKTQCPAVAIRLRASLETVLAEQDVVEPLGRVKNSRPVVRAGARSWEPVHSWTSSSPAWAALASAGAPAILGRDIGFAAAMRAGVQ